MADDPFKPQEIKLSRDEFSVRREIVPDTTPRGTLSQPKNLPSIFEDAHPWPLQWGGKEIKEGRFYAHKEFNNSAQKVMENAGVRLAKSANKSGVRIRCTVAVTKYAKHGARLLERATFKFEAVRKVGDDFKIAPLGEVTIAQDLSEKQRYALVNGKPLSDPKDPYQRFRVDINGKSEVVEIDPKKLVKVPSGDVFGDLNKNLGAFINGLNTAREKKKSARGKEVAKTEKSAIKEADRESKARTAVPPIRASDLTEGKAIETRNVEGGRPTADQRATTMASKPIMAKSPEPPPTTVSLKDKVQAAPKTPPTPEQVKNLESSLNKGQTDVKSAGGGRVAVTVRKATGVARGVVETGARAGRFAPGMSSIAPFVDPDVTVLDPNILMQKFVERRVGAGVQRGIQWLDQKFPMPDEVAPEGEGIRARYLAAKQELSIKGSLWRAQVKPGSQYGIQAREDAYRSIQKSLGAIDGYHMHIAGLVPKLAAKRDELDPIANQIEPYLSALTMLADELEGKVELALRLPGGHPFALELFSLSQFVRGVGKQVGQLTSVIAEKDRDYRQAIEKLHKAMDEVDRLDDEWAPLLVEAEQAAGL